MVCTTLGSLLHPLFSFLCSILLIHRVHIRNILCFVGTFNRSTYARNADVQESQHSVRFFTFTNPPECNLHSESISAELLKWRAIQRNVEIPFYRTRPTFHLWRKDMKRLTER